VRDSLRYTNEQVGELPISLTCFLVEEGRLFTQRGPALALPRRYSAGHSARQNLVALLSQGATTVVADAGFQQAITARQPQVAKKVLLFCSLVKAFQLTPAHPIRS
jgi:hypothetical protein